MASSKPQQLTPFGAAFAGALGGCFSNAIVYPLDVAKTRIQAATDADSRKRKLSMWSVLLKILQEEGIGGLYRGFGATMLNTFSMQYAYFFFYSLVRTSYLKRLTARLPKGSHAPQLSTAAELLLGAIAGGLAQIFTIPVAVIATRQQIGRSRGGNSRSTSPPTSDVEKGAAAAPSSSKSTSAAEEKPCVDSFLGVAQEIIEEEGVGGLWLGIRPGLVLTVNPAITYGVYERVKSMVLMAKERTTGVAMGPNDKLDPWMSFALGATSKTLATIVTYPYIMAKVRIQARSADEEDAVLEHHPKPHPHEFHHNRFQHVGALDILARVWRKEGFVGWYQGMSAQVTKAVISQALLFLSKEQFEHWTLAMMVFLYGLRRSST